jgi:hypothetical protein
VVTNEVEAEMSVDLTVNWKFVTDDGEVSVFEYRTATPRDAPVAASVDDSPVATRDWGVVLPLSSSVVSPGLAMPIPAT